MCTLHAWYYHCGASSSDKNTQNNSWFTCLCSFVPNYGSLKQQQQQQQQQRNKHYLSEGVFFSTNYSLGMGGLKQFGFDCKYKMKD